MPVNRSFERELAVLESMSGHVPDAQEVAQVRKALGNSNNYLVAKAAKIATEHNLNSLFPEVLVAFDRFFVDPVKDDPQCWAKIALAKALVKLGCQDAEVFLRGMRHHQEEPVWGGHSDTAGALRGTCAHALVNCPQLSEAVLLNLLLEPLVDTDKTVRMEAARAIGHVGSESAELLIKLRILLRKEDPEVLGACFSALLCMDRNKQAAIRLVADFLEDGEDAAAEAAYSLAETHDAMSLAALISRRVKGCDPWFGSVLDNAIALTRLQEGMNYLLNVIERDPRQASSALEAISRVHHSPDVRERVAAAVHAARNERVLLAFRQYFPVIAREA